MRILIASDLHGRVNAVTRLLAVIKELQPDKILLLGDFLYNGPRNGVPFDYDGMAVANLLNPQKERIVGVKGNCDARIDEDMLSFSLADRREIDLVGRHCILVHGDNLRPEFVRAKPGDIVMYGHIHLPVLEEKDGVTFLNPGSTSFPKGGNPASFAILDDESIRILNLYDMTPIKVLNLTR